MKGLGYLVEYLPLQGSVPIENCTLYPEWWAKLPLDAPIKQTSNGWRKQSMRSAVNLTMANIESSDLGMDAPSKTLILIFTGADSGVEKEERFLSDEMDRMLPATDHNVAIFNVGSDRVTFRAR